MRRYRMLVFVLIICGGLTLTVAEQRNPQRPAPGPQATPGQGQANPEQNKLVARRVFDDLFTAGRYGEIDQIYDRNCKVHFGNRSESLDQAVAEGKGWRSAAPDLVMTADQITVSGDVVNVVWSARGTHTGQGHGLKPTGKRINVRGRSTFRFANGKIVEASNDDYRPELFRQLGVPPTQAWLYEKGEDIWLAVHHFFSGAEPASASVQPSAQ
ncbi:MAG TPA: ester cyclase [Rugosimonospora sp.]|nr:ester cyclase [Rugosimonospora sp.]